MLESDPVGAAQKPPVVRAPNGVVEDGFKYWSAGTATYNPGAIIAPTLVVHGEWDNDTPGYVAQAVLQQLTHARFKRYAAIPRGTHSVIMERNRETLFRTVQAFLEEKR